MFHEYLYLYDILYRSVTRRSTTYRTRKAEQHARVIIVETDFCFPGMFYDIVRAVYRSVQGVQRTVLVKQNMQGGKDNTPPWDDVPSRFSV